MARRTSCLAAGLVVSLCGCDDTPMRSGFDARVQDSGPRDAGTPSDGGDPGDAGSGLDAGDGGIAVRCSLGASVDVLTAYDTYDKMQLDLAAGASDAMLVVRRLSVADYPAQEVVSVLLSPGGVIGATTPLSTNAASTLQEPAVAPRGSGYVAAWSDNEGAHSLDVLTRELDSAGAPVDVPIRRTVSAAADWRLDLLPVAGGTLFAWIEHPSAGADVPRVALLDVDGTFGTALDATSAAFTTRPVFATLNDVPYVAFRALSGKMRVSSVSADASSVGVPHDVSFSTEVAGTWDFARSVGNDDGAVVFQIDSPGRSSVGFRSIPPNGQPTLAEVELQGVVNQGFAPSIAPLAGGYLVAYRHRSQASELTLRVLLVDLFGNVLDADDAETISAQDADVRIVVSADQQPYVVYEEPTTVTLPGDSNASPGTVLRAIPVTCGAVP